MERFIPVKVFERKVIPSEVFPFSRFYRNSRKFLHTYQCHVILLRKSAKDLKDGGRFPNLKDGGRFPNLKDGGRFPNLKDGGRFPKRVS